MPKQSKALLTIPDLMEYLTVSESWVRTKVRERKIPHLKVGGNIRFRAEVIERWLDENTRDAA